MRFYMDSRSDRDLFRKENLGPLSTLAAFATLAIENARRFESAKREIATLMSADSSRFLVGDSPVMQELYAMIDRVSPHDLPVMITGESGTGKELVAREIHRRSLRQGKPFLALYCGNVSPELFESELFRPQERLIYRCNTRQAGARRSGRGRDAILG